MKIEKLACCLAKPMNAIRDLAAKVNELITAHNDHLENHPSGGGGGGSSTPGVCTVTVVSEVSDDMSTYNFVSKDKMFEELKTTYIAGGLPWCRLHLVNENIAGPNGMDMQCHITGYIDMGADGTGFIFTPVNMDNPMVTIMNNEMVLVQND